MALTAAASSGSAMWFLTRATGITTLVLLTVTVALGVANVRRMSLRGVQRFVFDAVHRNAALLSVAFLAVHVVTTVLDGYVPVRWLDAVVPFGSAYRSFWLGLGALSLDLMAAVIITSLLRRQLGHRAWRATHWLAYGSWPLALAHALGMGTDAGTGWMLAIALACVATVLGALALRLRGAGDAPTTTPRRPGPPRSRDHGSRPRPGAVLTGGRR